MLEVLQRCFPERLASADWQERLLALLPSFYSDPKSDPDVLKGMRERSDGLLGPQPLILSAACYPLSLLEVHQHHPRCDQSGVGR